MEGMERFFPVEDVFKMQYLEQYVQSVVHYSSRYNNQLNYCYSPTNLLGKYEKYPSYGDFPEAYFLVSCITYFSCNSTEVCSEQISFNQPQNEKLSTIFVQRSYGKWWRYSGSAQKEYRPQDFDLLSAEDFVTLE